jgi:hypothetical protein
VRGQAQAAGAGRGVTTLARWSAGGDSRISIESFARATNLHPDLVRRFVTLGLLEAVEDANGTLWFSVTQITAAARLQRLRAAFTLNYAALGLVADLLDRIAELEAAARPRVPPTGGPKWT